MPRAIGQVERVLDGLTIGLVKDKEARDRQLAQGAARECEQQVRVGVHGEVGNGWGAIDKTVFWTLPFIWAPSQRDVPYRTPHFSYGIEMRSISPPPPEAMPSERVTRASAAEERTQEELIVVHAQILKWITNDSSLVEGARIRFAACGPNLRHTRSFQAVAHLTFQGWAAEIEEGEEG